MSLPSLPDEDELADQILMLQLAGRDKRQSIRFSGPRAAGLPTLHEDKEYQSVIDLDELARLEDFEEYEEYDE